MVRRVISEATAQQMKLLLADVLKPGGTGAKGALARYQAAGKTGTAQKGNHQKGGYHDNRFTASFVGFAPVTDPRILVVVVINEPKKESYGGVVAAPAFRRIAEQSLHTLQVPPEKAKNKVGKVAASDGAGPPEQQELIALQPVGYVQTDSEILTVMPDLTGLSLRSALDQLRHFTGSLEISGSGRVVGQNPAPGKNLKTVDSCSLILTAD